MPVTPFRRLLAWHPLGWGAGGLTALLLLGCLFYAEENWRGRRAWTACQRELRAKGVDFNWHALAPPPVADRENFATTPFFAALFDYTPGTHTPRDMAAYNRSAGFAATGAPYEELRRGSDPAPAMFARRRTDLAGALKLFRPSQARANAAAEAQPDPGDRSATARALLETLAPFNPVLQELRVAARRPQARFNFSYGEPNSWRLPQPHLPVLKRVSHVLTLRASAGLALGNVAEAADNVPLIFRLADSIRDEPFRSSLAARQTLLADARQIIWEGLAAHRWSDAQLQDFAARMQDLSLLRDLQKPLRVEQAARNELFDELHRRPAIVKDWQFGPGLWNGALPYFFWLMPSGWMYQEQVAYHRAFEDQILPALDSETARIKPWLIYDAGHGRSPVWHHRLLANLLLQSASGPLIQTAFAQTMDNEVSLACALERYRLTHGQFPETLEALAPALLATLPSELAGGQPLKYQRTADGRFQLYSIGCNGKDDGGKTVLCSDGKTPDANQGDWVWPQYPDE